MEKAKVNMKNWQRYVYKKHYSLSGTADNHPVLGRNVYVGQTSSLVDYKIEDDILIYETNNTIYICPLKYMTIHPYGNVVLEYRNELSHLADESDSELDQIISAAAKLSLEDAKSYNYKNVNENGRDNYIDALFCLAWKNDLKIWSTQWNK